MTIKKLKKKRPSKRALQQKIKELKERLDEALKDALDQRLLADRRWDDWAQIYREQLKQAGEYLRQKDFLQTLARMNDPNDGWIAFTASALLRHYTWPEERLREMRTEVARAIVSQLESAPTDTLREEIADIRQRYLQ